jgi:hypothetical protein
MNVLQITYPMLAVSSVVNSQALHSHRQDAWNERYWEVDSDAAACEGGAEPQLGGSFPV